MEGLKLDVRTLVIIGLVVGLILVTRRAEKERVERRARIDAAFAEMASVFADATERR